MELCAKVNAFHCKENMRNEGAKLIYDMFTVRCFLWGVCSLDSVQRDNMRKTVQKFQLRNLCSYVRACTIPSTNTKGKSLKNKSSNKSVLKIENVLDCTECVVSVLQKLTSKHCARKSHEIFHSKNLHGATKCSKFSFSDKWETEIFEI